MRRPASRPDRQCPLASAIKKLAYYRREADNAATHGRFDRADFTNIVGEDAYVCLAGARLTYRFTNTEAGKTLRSYWTYACGSCAIKGKCITGQQRRVRRWEHEELIERVQKARG